MTRFFSFFLDDLHTHRHDHLYLPVSTARHKSLLRFVPIASSYFQRCFNFSDDGSRNYYPCGTGPINIDCVRDFMLSSGKCTAVSHSDGDPIYMRSQIAHSPKLNLTIEYTDVQATYYEPEIESF